MLSLVADAALCWLKHHARSAGQCDQNIAHRRVCSVSVLHCQRHCHSLLGSHNRRLNGRYDCGPSTASELWLISSPNTAPRELLLVEYLLDPQESCWGCHNCFLGHGCRLSSSCWWAVPVPTWLTCCVLWFTATRTSSHPADRIMKADRTSSIWLVGWQNANTFKILLTWKLWRALA